MEQFVKRRLVKLIVLCMQNRIIEIMQRDRQLSVAKFILSLKISINYNFLLCNIVNGKANESFRCNILTLKN